MRRKLKLTTNAEIEKPTKVYVIFPRITEDTHEQVFFEYVYRFYEFKDGEHEKAHYYATPKACIDGYLRYREENNRLFQNIDPFYDPEQALINLQDS